MQPSHFRRCFLIAFTRSKVVELGRASCGIELPVKRDSILLFAPLIMRLIGLVRRHPSQPYVRTEQTATLYRRSFKASERSGELRTWRSSPHLCMADAMRIRTSWAWLESALKWELFYLLVSRPRPGR